MVNAYRHSYLPGTGSFENVGITKDTILSMDMISVLVRNYHVTKDTGSASLL
jgi:hypothetical protein